MKAFFVGLAVTTLLVALAIGFFPILEQPSAVKSPYVLVKQEG